jgi:hypothetical protein
LKPEPVDATALQTSAKSQGKHSNDIEDEKMAEIIEDNKEY